MAFRLRWIVVALVGCVLVTGAALSAKLPRLWQAPEPGEATARYRALVNQARAELGELRQAAEHAAVEPLLPPGSGITIVAQAPLPSVWQDSLVAGVRRELAGTMSLRARIGVFALPAATLPEPAGLPRLGPLYHLHARRTPEPTCVVIGSGPRGGPYTERVRSGVFHVLSYRAGAGWTNGPQVLRGCRFWARYGAPGAQLAGWLERRGYHFAEAAWSPPARRPDSARARRLFGRQAELRPELDGDALACFAGTAAACRSHFLEPAGPAPARGLPGPNLADRSLLAALEQEFGAEAFGRFWRSDDDVASAFTAAFKVPVEEWLPQWLAGTYGTSGGPAVPLNTAALALLTLGGLFGVGVATVVRRRI